jgi:hypothetical protein
VPGITQTEYTGWENNWYWSFTKAAIDKVFAELYPGNTPEVACYGNVLVAAAFLYGMGVTEITKDQLDHFDPHYQLIVTGKVTKPLAA